MEKPCVKGHLLRAGWGVCSVAPGVCTWDPSQGLRVWGGEWTEDRGGVTASDGQGLTGQGWFALVGSGSALSGRKVAWWLCVGRGTGRTAGCGPWWSLVSVYICTRFVDSYLCRWTLGVLPSLGCCEPCCCKHG